MSRTVSFNQMKDGTKDDYLLLEELEKPHLAMTAERIIAELQRQDEASLAGYKITRLGHALQSATRASRDGADMDWIVGALLHDIGKIGIPERILHKPAPLTNQEYEIIKSHTTLGGDLLETSQGLRHLSPYVRHHHEWWDGSGYPKGLCGEQIPLAARILAVCDAAEAMASTRPYQRALPLEQVVQELRNGAGTQFDPDVVKAFVFLADTQSPWLVEQPAITEMQW